MLKRINDDKIVQIAEDSPLKKARILEVDIDFCHSLLEAQLSADKKVIEQMIEELREYCIREILHHERMLKEFGKQTHYTLYAEVDKGEISALQRIQIKLGNLSEKYLGE